MPPRESDGTKQGVREIPTIIDALIVELSLDPSKFTKGQKDAAAGFVKTKEEAARAAKDIEASGSKAASFFAKMRTEFLALTAALLSADAIKRLVIDTSRADDSTGRLAKTLGIAVETLSRWQIAARLAGGSADGMANTIAKLSDDLQTYDITGVAPPMLAWLQQLVPHLRDASGHVKSVTQIMDDMNEAVQRFDMPKRRAVLEGLGIDRDSINLLIQNRDAFKAFFVEADKFGKVTEEDAAAARELSRALEHLPLMFQQAGRAITTYLTRLRNSDFFGSGKMPWWAPSELFKTLPGDIKKSIEDGRAFLDDMHGETESYIRDAATKRGINPDVAVAVAKSEGLGKNYTGDAGSSFGPFQLHRGGIAPGGNAVGGLGDEFAAKTGLDPRDPATKQAQIDFSLDYAKAHGWGPWHGFRGLPTEGITGLSLGAPGAASAAAASIDNSRRSTSSTDVTINGVTINGVDTNSAPGVAAGLGNAVKNRAFSNSAQSGAQ